MDWAGRCLNEIVGWSGTFIQSINQSINQSMYVCVRTGCKPSSGCSAAPGGRPPAAHRRACGGEAKEKRMVSHLFLLAGSAGTPAAVVYAPHAEHLKDAALELHGHGRARVEGVLARALRRDLCVVVVGRLSHCQSFPSTNPDRSIQQATDRPTDRQMDALAPKPTSAPLAPVVERFRP